MKTFDYMDVSPLKYIYPDSSRLNRECSRNPILRSQIDSIDMDILNHLYTYDYLNRHNIEVLMGISDCKDRIASLVKIGAIERCYVSSPAGERISGLNFYRLSDGGLSLLKKKEIALTLDINLILCKLAVNQFIISSTFSVLDYSRTVENVTVFAVLEYKGIKYTLEPLRRAPGAEKIFLDRAMAYSDKIDGTLLVLCEDDVHIRTARMALAKGDFTGEVYFTTDVRALNRAAHTNLLRVDSLEDGRYVIEEISLDKS